MVWGWGGGGEGRGGGNGDGEGARDTAVTSQTAEIRKRRTHTHTHTPTPTGTRRRTERENKNQPPNQAAERDTGPGGITWCVPPPQPHAGQGPRAGHRDTPGAGVGRWGGAAKKPEAPRASETRWPRWEMGLGGGELTTTPTLWEGGQSPTGEQPLHGDGGSTPARGGGLSVGHAGRAGDAHAAAPSGSYSLWGRAS